MGTAMITDKPSELTTSREPGPSSKAQNVDMGAQALKDATIIVVACWLFLALLMITLRKYNV